MCVCVCVFVCVCVCVYRVNPNQPRWAHANGIASAPANAASAKLVCSMNPQTEVVGSTRAESTSVLLLIKSPI